MGECPALSRNPTDDLIFIPALRCPVLRDNETVRALKKFSAEKQALVNSLSIPQEPETLLLLLQ